MTMERARYLFGTFLGWLLATWFLQAIGCDDAPDCPPTDLSSYEAR